MVTVDYTKKDDGRMTPGCVTCPKWHDSVNDLGGECSLPKSATFVECPYLRGMMLNMLNKRGGKH